MGDTNLVILHGAVGKVYERRNNGPLAWSVATREQWRDADGAEQERTSWHRVCAWRGLAERLEAEGLAAGDRVLIEGGLQSRSWEDAQGQKRETTEVVADRVLVVPGARRPAEPAPVSTPRERPAGGGTVARDDLRRKPAHGLDTYSVGPGPLVPAGEDELPF